MTDLAAGTWLVTGGCGFVGAEFIRQALAAHPHLRIVNLDALSYAASPERLAEVVAGPAATRYTFIKGDIARSDDVLAAFVAAGTVDAIVNIAAESHVDRSLSSGVPFVRSNALGVQVLLETAQRANEGQGIQRFLQVSTDEVYGDVEAPRRSVETDPIRTSSPYSASKAAGELLVQAFVRSFGFPAIITRCTNNYGPWHWPEKMIPLFVTNLLAGKTVPVYGDGRQRRDWIHVADHAAGLLAALLKGRDGEIYNFGGDPAGGGEIDNLTLTRKLLALAGRDESAIAYVKDRPGHDRRYALDSSKARRELEWKPQWTLDAGLRQTFEWFVAHQSWLATVLDENYRAYYRQQYGER